MKKIFLLVLISFILITPLFIKEVFAQNSLEIYFFWGEGCSYCAKEELFLENLVKKYPQIEIRDFEIYKNSENRELLQEFIQNYNVQYLGVPLTFIKDKYFPGYRDDESTGKEIENYIQSILKNEQVDLLPVIKVPIFGEVNLSEMSLPVLTITFGALDGLNPCAMWILLFLVALLINTRSRKRMWLIGGTFILASGIVYFLILAAWLNLFLAISYISLIRILIGIFALGVGVWQIKNFIKFKPGVCPVTSGRPGLKDRIESDLRNQAEKLTLSPFTLGTLIGLVVLAFAINLIELFCSAGLPAIYTHILASNQLNQWTYYLYLLLYTFIFMLDDLIVFSLAVITLNKIGFSEKYNYWATLIGGLLMFILGILLIFKPEILMFG